MNTSIIIYTYMQSNYPILELLEETRWRGNRADNDSASY
jgi:hypothetical protein